MKFVVFFSVFLLSAVHLSLQIPKLKNCPPDFILTPSMANSCGVITCIDTNTIAQLACPLYQCIPEKYLGYEEPDNSKQYPDCCGGPICAD